MSGKTLLLFDVGNTNTKVGVAEGGRLGPCYTLPTAPRDTSDGWGLALLDLCRHAGTDPASVEAFLVSSVVPAVNPLLAGAASRFFSCPALFAPGDLPIPLENRYERPHEVGADILVGAFAARRLFPAEHLAVIDFGTATTIACVSGNAFLGGLICPGLMSSARALAANTAKLPLVGFSAPDEPLRWGRSTVECLSQGFVFGFAAMVEGLVSRLALRFGARPLVVATGGFAPTVASVCTAMDEVRPGLLMEGLLLARKESNP